MAAVVGRPEEKDVPCHEEDPAVEGGIGGGATIDEELDLQRDKQSSGSVDAPGHFCSGVDIGRPPSREGSDPGIGPAARGSDTPAYQLWGSASHATEAQICAAPEQRVSFLI